MHFPFRQSSPAFASCCSCPSWCDLVSHECAYRKRNHHEAHEVGTREVSPSLNQAYESTIRIDLAVIPVAIDPRSRHGLIRAIPAGVSQPGFIRGFETMTGRPPRFVVIWRRLQPAGPRFRIVGTVEASLPLFPHPLEDVLRNPVPVVREIEMKEITRILTAIEAGDPQAAEQLLPIVYDEFRVIAAQRL